MLIFQLLKCNLILFLPPWTLLIERSDNIPADLYRRLIFVVDIFQKFLPIRVVSDNAFSGEQFLGKLKVPFLQKQAFVLYFAV